MSTNAPKLWIEACRAENHKTCFGKCNGMDGQQHACCSALTTRPSTISPGEMLDNERAGARAAFCWGAASDSAAATVTSARRLSVKLRDTLCADLQQHATSNYIPNNPRYCWPAWNSATSPHLAANLGPTVLAALPCIANCTM